MLNLEIKRGNYEIISYFLKVSSIDLFKEWFGRKLLFLRKESNLLLKPE